MLIWPSARSGSAARDGASTRCRRRTFSTPTQILAKSNANVRTAEDLRARAVCAARGSVALATIADPKYGARPIGATTITECMVRFQRGEVDMIAGDRVILSGLVRQDPFAAIGPFNLGDNSYGVTVAWTGWIWFDSSTRSWPNASPREHGPNHGTNGRARTPATPSTGTYLR